MRVDQLAEAIDYFSILNFHGSDFSYSIIFRRKSRSLKVENNKIIKCSSFEISCYDLLLIIDHVSLDPIDDLNVLAHFHGISKSLYYTMISNGNGFMPPLYGPLYQIPGV